MPRALTCTRILYVAGHLSSMMLTGCVESGALRPIITGGRVGAQSLCVVGGRAARASKTTLSTLRLWTGGPHGRVYICMWMCAGFLKFKSVYNYMIVGSTHLHVLTHTCTIINAEGMVSPTPSMTDDALK